MSQIDPVLLPLLHALAPAALPIAVDPQLTPPPTPGAIAGVQPSVSVSASGSSKYCKNHKSTLVSGPYTTCVACRERKKEAKEKKRRERVVRADELGEENVKAEKHEMAQMDLEVNGDQEMLEQQEGEEQEHDPEPEPVAGPSQPRKTNAHLHPKNADGSYTIYPSTSSLIQALATASTSQDNEIRFSGQCLVDVTPVHFLLAQEGKSARYDWLHERKVEVLASLGLKFRYAFLLPLPMTEAEFD